MHILKKWCQRARTQDNGYQRTVIWIVGAIPVGILFLTIACSSNETAESTPVPSTDQSSIATSVAAPTATQIPALQPSPTSAPEPTNTPIPTVEPLLRITAVELYGEREANATRYDVQYKGKKVRISGLVGKIDGGQISLVVDHATFNLLDTTFLESIELHDLPINDQIKANKGEGFEAVCTVGDYILGSIQLRDCADGEAVDLATETVPGETASRKTASSTAGTLIVGQDIEPGRYKAEVVDGLVPICYWARLSETDGELSSIIANNTAMEGSVYVTIKPDDFAFESTGCTNWELQDDAEVEAGASQQASQESSVTQTPEGTLASQGSAESTDTPVPSEIPTPEIETPQAVESESSVPPTDTPTPEGTPASEVSAEPTDTPVSTATPAPEIEATRTTEPNHTSISFGPGTYLVGSDIRPGRYKAGVASGSFGCSWSRLNDTDGELSSIIAISLITEGQTYVTVKATDVAFETSGCTEFALHTKDSSQAETGLTEFGPGTYLVRSEIQVGRYKAEVASGSFGCSWSRLSETDGELSSVIAIALVTEGQTYVTIKESDYAFETSGCTDFFLHAAGSPQADPGLRQMGAGTYLVGSEVQPGVYRAQVAPGSFGCSWSRLSETDGELDSVIAIDLILEGQTYVTIEETDFAFETSGCTNWEQQQ